MKKVFFLLIISFIVHSCARVGAPVGGNKDTLAPRFLGANIDSSRTKVPVLIRELRLDFDEYINLKDIQKQLIISPPIKNIKKIIPSNLANKYVLIQWGDTLQANTTYSFNFGNAIVDNNEGNILPYFNFAFSTGEKLDSLYLAGTAQNALSTPNSEAQSKSNIVVGLYKASDSINFREKPYYITKADKDGYFELEYLAQGKYKVITFDDENMNSVYDKGKENLGFIKDELNVTKGISGLKLTLYPPKKEVKYKEIKAIDGGLLLLFEGKPEKIEVKEITGLVQDYKVSHQKFSDSVRVWFDAQKENLSSNQGTNLKFSYDTKVKKDTVQIFYRTNPKEEFTLKNNEGALLPPNRPFRITANMELKELNTQQWELKVDSTHQQPFKARIAETSPNTIIIESDFQKEKKYRLFIPKESVSSFYKSNAKPYVFEFEADTPQNYGSVTIRLKNKPSAPFWIELLDQQNKVLSSRKTTEAEHKFTELKPSTYYIRILVDNNGNGIWDTADLATNTLAEDYFVFPKKIEARQLWDLVEDWELPKQEVSTTENNNK
ncbi:Ig-like domain-containing protein [Riemerella anatipestifer]|nr:Ig-like domain-containing protein [Riemerella anatipestifer]MDY3533792.1 Ig-like domain-containing protein [Riemerella anatipestifer]MDY3535876.1 Ig-like domain-containing protein [Riemerella anatipestifer]